MAAASVAPVFRWCVADLVPRTTATASIASLTGLCDGASTVGREFVDWLIERNFARNRVQAESLAASMEQQGLLKHVTRAHPFKDAYLFYRFLVLLPPTAIRCVPTRAPI